MKTKSNLESVLESGHFAVCGEMSPPQGADKESILKKCKYFKNIVDAVNFTDNQTAIARMSSVASSIIGIEGGIEPIMQMTCRDRNRLAQQSDVLGAYAFDVKNLLCLTGDYQSFGNHPESRGVFDLDSIQLIKTVSDMNNGKFMSGDEMKNPPRMFIGGAANPFGEPLEMRILRLGKKIYCGANFIQTQPVFDIPRFTKWLDAVKYEGYDDLVYILAGVMPVRSVKALLYMQENVPGMSIADEYIKRMQSVSSSKEASVEEGVAICVEIMKQLMEMKGVKGLHIMPVMWESITARLVEEAGLLPRPVIEPLPVQEPILENTSAEKDG